MSACKFSASFCLGLTKHKRVLENGQSTVTKDSSTFALALHFNQVRSTLQDKLYYVIEAGKSWMELPECL